MVGVSILCDTLEHGPRFQDESGKSDTTEIGARPQLGNDVRKNC